MAITSTDLYHDAREARDAAQSLVESALGLLIRHYGPAQATRIVEAIAHDRRQRELSAAPNDR